LIAYATNPRLHSEADLDKLAASIRKWGWTNPVLVDEQGVLIAGHGRVAAAARLGLKSIPVIIARGWSDAEKQAYRLADNELAARSSWDPDLLRNELRDLKFSGFDLELIGFEPDRLEDILAELGSRGLTDPDSTPEIPENPVTQSGDTWLAGSHRIGCGDSTNAADVEPVLAGSQPDLMITDPPYGVNYHPSWRRCLGSGELAQGKVLNDDRADWRQAYALFTGDVAYVWHGALHGDVVAGDLAACGLQLRAQIVWVKQHFSLSRGHYHWQHENCWYAVRKGKPGHWQRGPQADHGLGDRQQQSIRQSTARAELGARHPEAGRVHAPSDRQQQPPGPAGL
jgi:hypothetical protein